MLQAQWETHHSYLQQLLLNAQRQGVAPAGPHEGAGPGDTAAPQPPQEQPPPPQ